MAAAPEFKLRVTPTNAPGEFVEFDFNGTPVHVPAALIAELLIAKLQQQVAQVRATAGTPPAIGSPWPGLGGIYAGVVRGNQGTSDYHLIVADEPQLAKATWKDAGSWARGLQVGIHTDYDLPLRKELAVLFGNVPELFETEWYWSGEQYAGNDAYAWYQSFSNGNQYVNHKGNQLRARAVRRLTI